MCHLHNILGEITRIQLQLLMLCSVKEKYHLAFSIQLSANGIL